MVWFFIMAAVFTYLFVLKHVLGNIQPARKSKSVEKAAIPKNRNGRLEAIGSAR
ncbi:hypothetical protein [Peribacillus sp. SCS-37]|uniref:hypothetical protein n=1 Tax=Paraperibacillus esterisolvens TaxID=3115296 RepID=UPI0039060F6F